MFDFGSILGGVIGGLGSLFGGGSQEDALEEQNRILEQASKRALRWQKEVYAQNREDLAPWREIGQDAIRTLATGLAAGKYDPGEFRWDSEDLANDPGYQFRLQEGNKAVNRQAAAQGNLLSGAQLKAAANYNQGLASQEASNAFNRSLTTYQANAARLGDQYNRLAGLAQGGQQTAVQTAQLGANMANANQANILGTASQIGQNVALMGQNRASMYSNLAGGANQLIENLLTSRLTGMV